MIYKSHAKVNIGLQIIGDRDDGYHNIHTIFQELNFHDTVHLSKKDHGCVLTSNNKNFPTDESNTCLKAMAIVKENFKHLGGVSIHVEKNIPQGAGLGGGSSNAAAVIQGVNELYACNFSDEEMKDMAKAVGADVPFFLKGGTQLGEGIGEQLTPIDYKNPHTFLLVIPPISISTSWAYMSLKKPLEGRPEKANFPDLFRRDPIPFEFFKNDFERIVIPAHPEIGVIKDSLLRIGAKYASLSGSGSTVFGMFDKDTTAKEAESILSSDYRTILTAPIQR